MKIPADVIIESATIHWLREQGHDVVWAAEDYHAMQDDKLLVESNQTSRILLTRDLDFGELVFREQKITTGIILLRIKVLNQHERLEVLKQWWNQLEVNIQDNFILVTNKLIQIRPLKL